MQPTDPTCTGLAAEVRDLRRRLARSEAKRRHLVEYIAASRQATSRHQQTASRLQALFDNALDAMLLVNDTSYFVGANPAACSLLGYSRDELLSQSIYTISVPQDQELTARLWGDFFARGSASGEHTVRCKDDSRRTVEFHAVANVLPGLHLSIFRDITERKKLQEERDQLLERMRLQVNRLPFAYILLDENYRVLDWNPSAERIFGYHREEALGRVCLELIVDLPLDERLQAVLRRLETGDLNAHSINENRTKDGRIITCEWFNTPLRATDGSFAGNICLAQDISERRHVEELLEQSRRRFQAVFENALEPILLMDSNGRYVDVNSAACELLGYGREELLQLTVWDITPVEHRQSIPELLLAFIVTGTMSGEWPLLCKGGATRVVEFRAVANILPGLHLAIHRDVTERQRAAQALRESEGRLRALTENVPLLVWSCTSERVCDYVNPQFARYVGLPEAALLGAWRMDLMHPDDHHQLFAAWNHGMGGAVSVEFEARLRRHDGDWRWFQVSAVPLRDVDGRVIKWFGTCIDFDDRKRTEEALRESMRRLQTLSHRLLAVQEEERRHLARELHDEFGQVLATITLHLHAARSLAGEAARPQLEQCAVLLQQAGEQVRNLALELRPTMLETLGLESTLRWLVGNYRQPGGPEVQVVGHLSGAPPTLELAIGCYRVAQEAMTNIVRHAQAQHTWLEMGQGDGTLKLVVRDDGVGFETTSTEQQAARRGRLGLLGMRERVEILGGSLEIESQPGCGTRIRATFPLAVGDEAAEPPE